VVTRVRKALANSYLVSDAEGAWYLIQGGPPFTVYLLDADLKPTQLGEIAGRGFHTIRIADARFIAPDVLRAVQFSFLARAASRRHRKAQCPSISAVPAIASHIHDT